MSDDGGLRERLVETAAATLAERVNPNCPWPEKDAEDQAVYRSDAAAMLAAVLPLLADRDRLAMRLHDAFFATEHADLMGYPLWLAMADNLLGAS